jgi:hypothetical protein
MQSIEPFRQEGSVKALKRRTAVAIETIFEGAFGEQL